MPMKFCSLLTTPLPHSICVDGTELPIVTNHRLGMLMQEIADAPDLDDTSRMQLVLRLYCGTLPKHIDKWKAFLAIMDFYAMDPDGTRKGTDGGNLSIQKEPLLDFAIDGYRILASFRQTYGIDLLRCTLHWWEYMALLYALPEDTPFMQVVRLRTADPRKIQDDGLRRQLRQAKAAVRIRKKQTKQDTAKMNIETEGT